MPTNNLQRQIADLMRKSGKAHHQAFIDADGEDPEWPIWYADYLLEPLGKLLRISFTRSQLVYCLMNVEFEREATTPGAGWHDYYAAHFIEHFAASETPATDKLALYHSFGCPFCVRVRSALEHLGIDVELRDIEADRRHFDDLVTARNRATVPVLRIISAGGGSRWMPESRDIIQYLETNYG